MRVEPTDPNSLAEPPSGKTDNSGRYFVSTLLPGQYRITATHPDHAPRTQTVDVKAGAMAEVNLVME